MPPTPAPAHLPLAERLLLHPVLGRLDESRRHHLLSHLALQLVAAGQPVADRAMLSQQLHWLVDGSAQLLDGRDQPLVDLGTDELFGLHMGDGLDIQSAVARTDVRVARLDAGVLDELLDASPELAFRLGGARRADGEARYGSAGDAPAEPALNLMTTPVRALIKRAPVTVAPQTSIREAARMMSEQRVSSVLILQQDHLFGMVTDRDLRNRVIAAGLDSQRPVADIATLAPMTIDVGSPAFDALLLMARHNIHHVPVLDGAQVAGMITASDLTEQHSTSAVYLTGDIYKQASLDGLQAASLKVPRLQQNLAAADASAYSTGHIVTTITDAITTRLLQLGEAQLGPAPVDYVWVAAGSQARNEQTAKSDQDNCMVLDNAYDEALHGAYFKALAAFVCDGLNACGYVYCPGEMMAMTDQWRQPQRRWAEYFRQWTSVPDPKALMLTCVFFDLRAVHGQTRLLDDLRRDVLHATRGNTLFLAHMSSNALQHQPPLGLFRGIATIRNGAHRGTVDLKHTGVVPIVDLARIYALAAGDMAVNTHDRLLGAADGGAISEQSARDLRDALEFLAFMRIQHQARQMRSGEKPDNYLRLEELSNFERTQLKDAFGVVQSLQSVLGQRYRM